MSNDPMAHLATLRRPGAVIGWVAGLYLLTTVPLAAVSFDEGWRHPVEAMTAWMVAFLMLAAPLAGLATVLAARMERATTGLRHPMRGAWLGVSLGVFLVVHWLIHLAWSPLSMFWALTSSWNREDHVVGAFLGLLAWAFALAGAWLARATSRRLEARDWTGAPGTERVRVLPRLPTPWVAAIAYAWAVLPMSGFVAVVGIDEDMPIALPAVWAAVGAFTGLVGGWLGSWTYDSLTHAREPTRLAPRAVELFGCAWVAHWAPTFLIAVQPLWADQHHEPQLAVSLLAAMGVLVGVAAWSYGRAARLNGAA